MSVLECGPGAQISLLVVSTDKHGLREMPPLEVELGCVAEGFSVLRGREPSLQAIQITQVWLELVCNAMSQGSWSPAQFSDCLLVVNSVS